MFGLIRAEARQYLFIDIVPLRDQGVKRARHCHHIVEDEEIGDKMVIVDHLALFVPRILGQQTSTAEGDPLEKQVEGLAFIGRGLNGPAQLNAGNIFEQENRPDNGA